MKLKRVPTLLFLISVVLVVYTGCQQQTHEHKQLLRNQPIALEYLENSSPRFESKDAARSILKSFRFELPQAKEIPEFLDDEALKKAVTDILGPEKFTITPSLFVDPSGFVRGTLTIDQSFTDTRAFYYVFCSSLWNVKEIEGDLRFHSEGQSLHCPIRNKITIEVPPIPTGYKKSFILEFHEKIWMRGAPKEEFFFVLPLAKITIDTTDQPAIRAAEPESSVHYSDPILSPSSDFLTHPIKFEMPSPIIRKNDLPVRELEPPPRARPNEGSETATEHRMPPPPPFPKRN